MNNFLGRIYKFSGVHGFPKFDRFVVKNGKLNQLAGIITKYKKHDLCIPVGIIADVSYKKEKESRQIVKLLTSTGISYIWDFDFNFNFLPL